MTVPENVFASSHTLSIGKSEGQKQQGDQHLLGQEI